MKSWILSCVLIMSCLLAIPVTATAEDIVCLEAESAATVVAPARVVSSSAAVSETEKKVAKGASGEKYVEIVRPKLPKGDDGKTKAAPCYDVKTGTNVITFAFELKDDDHYALWCRVWWTDECGNSFFMTIDDAPAFTFGQDGVYKRWHWVRASKRLKQLVLAKGKHSLRIKIRETGVRVDQVLFARDPKYVPVGIE